MKIIEELENDIKEREKTIISLKEKAAFFQENLDLSIESNLSLYEEYAKTISDFESDTDEMRIKCEKLKIDANSQLDLLIALIEEKINFYRDEVKEKFSICEKRFKLLSWVLYISGIIIALHFADVSYIHKLNQNIEIAYDKSYLIKTIAKFSTFMNKLIIFTLLIYYLYIMLSLMVSFFYEKSFVLMKKRAILYRSLNKVSHMVFLNKLNKLAFSLKYIIWSIYVFMFFSLLLTIKS